MKLQAVTDKIAGAVVGVAIASGVAMVFMAIAVGSALTSLVEKVPRSEDKKSPKSFRSPALTHNL